MDLSDISTSLEHLQSQKDISELHEALYKGSEETVRLRLNKIMAEVNKLTNSGYKKIEESEEIIKTILENKLFLSIIKENYPIFIVYAVNTTKDYIFKLISPQELNSAGHFKRTALHYAVQKHLVGVVRLLLEAGANVNCRTKYGFTPLHLATSLQNEEICAILLNFGAEIEPNSLGLGNPLSIACGCKYVMEDNNCLVRPTSFNPKMAKLLIDRGANVNKSFLQACSDGSLEPVKFLLQFGANFRFQNKQGTSALHCAARGNSLRVVEFLLEKGLDVNIRNARNQTPLCYMLEHGNTEAAYLDMYEYLVDRGADVNARNNFCATALHYISLYDVDSKHSAECLLELGADFKLKPRERFTYCHPHPRFSLGKTTLISYIALHGNELGDYTNCYFGELELLLKAREYFEKSRLEVEKLKSRRIIKETTVSFYNFLNGGFYNAVQLLKNEEIKKVFVCREYYKEFPCYSFLLEKRFERVMILKDAVEKMESFLTNCLSKLPTLVNRKIFNLFHSSDFRKFEHGLFKCQNLVEQELDTNLEFGKIYIAEIVEIREIGLMVSLYSGMTPTLLPYSKIENCFSPNGLEDIGDIGEIEVSYWGRHPATGRIILTEPFF